jgi:hypothetical protein
LPTSLPGPWAVPQAVGSPTLGRAGWALGLGIAAAVFGAAALFNVLFLLLSVPLGILAIAFGVSGQRRIARSGGALTGHGLALAGWICGVVGLALPLAVFLSFFMIGLALGITRGLLGPG